MTSELRPAVEVLEEAARHETYDAAVAVIEADREAVRAEQAAYLAKARKEAGQNHDLHMAAVNKVVDLKAELAKFKALAETLAGALEAIFSRHDAKRPYHRNNAPGHGHETSGIWDADNGQKAGKPCEWCVEWNAARQAITSYKEQRDD